MALHHPGAALLALSILLLGILGFLQASDTPPIPVDQLTIEQAFLEVELMRKQLSIPGTPNATAKQEDILYRVTDLSLYTCHKPNDLLSSTHRQLMTKFRQAFINWPHHPVDPINLLFDKYYALRLLYTLMIGLVEDALKKGRGSDAQQAALSRAKWALKGLNAIAFQVQLRGDQPDDLILVEAAIQKTRNAVIALPKLDENGRLVFTGDGVFRLAIEPAGVSSSEPPIVSSGGNSAESAAGNLPQGSDSARGDGDAFGSAWQLPIGSAGNLLGVLSTREPKNNLFNRLKQPYFWGPAAILTGAGYYLLKRHPATSSSSDFYSVPKMHIDITSVASEGSSHLWSILGELGAVLIVVVIIVWFYCNKKAKTPSKKTTTAKRASRKSRQLSAGSSSPTNTSTTVGPTSN